ncbi:hypothetical protein GCM10011581_26710 [Saccharopolyspora subtropica]|uniref:GntR C-terminal domain-containing protein n=1 Tax=Saccharopolyspora thermophila TaxID=89367 RepID=A0A917JV31_9PSEU|nr:hypothetical protein GCM10011581_26710 [Saccharopolyspora subtropica]
MQATGNTIIPLMFEPFGRLLVKGRRETAAVGEIRANALEQHTRILHALESGDPAQARQAMAAHLAQTADDLRTHVIAKHPVE